MILRKIKNDIADNFTMIGNEVFHDKGLSLKAVGLFCLMWSLPDNWDLSVSGLAKIKKDEKASIRTGFKELEKAGYIRFKQERSAGKFSKSVCLVAYSPFTDFRYAEKPYTEKPYTENRTQENNNKYNPKKENTNKGTLARPHVQAEQELKPPKLMEVAQFAADEGLSADPRRFFDYYEARGWKLNGSPVSDWKALMRSWENIGYDSV